MSAKFSETSSTLHLNIEEKTLLGNHSLYGILRRLLQQDYPRILAEHLYRLKSCMAANYLYSRKIISTYKISFENKVVICNKCKIHYQLCCGCRVTKLKLGPRPNSCALTLMQVQNWI